MSSCWADSDFFHWRIAQRLSRLSRRSGCAAPTGCAPVAYLSSLCKCPSFPQCSNRNQHRTLCCWPGMLRLTYCLVASFASDVWASAGQGCASRWPLCSCSSWSEAFAKGMDAKVCGSRLDALASQVSYWSNWRQDRWNAKWWTCWTSWLGCCWVSGHVSDFAWYFLTIYSNARWQDSFLYVAWSIWSLQWRLLSMGHHSPSVSTQPAQLSNTLLDCLRSPTQTHIQLQRYETLRPRVAWTYWATSDLSSIVGHGYEIHTMCQVVSQPSQRNVELFHAYSCQSGQSICWCNFKPDQVFD